MTEYTVKWEIQLEAESHREAAKLARGIHLDQNSEALNFKVTKDDDGTIKFINLMDYNGEI